MICLLGAAPFSCDSSSVFETPLVRVDLRQQLPPKVRRIVASGIPAQCQKKVSVPAQGLSPSFVVEWRALEIGGGRYVTAVEVKPDGDGRIDGLGGAKGGATVGKMTNVGSPSAPIAAVPVHIRWNGKKGCGSVEAKTEVTLRADDASCKKPKTPKLLRPVK